MGGRERRRERERGREIEKDRGRRKYRVGRPFPVWTAAGDIGFRVQGSDLNHRVCRLPPASLVPSLH